MADYNSSFPVRTENNGDVAAKIVDGTTPSQALSVDASGLVGAKTYDRSGVGIDSQTLATTHWLQIVSPGSGSSAPGTASAYAELVAGIYNSTPPTLTNGQQTSLQLDSHGRLLVSTVSTDDHNYGTVGASTLRIAAQIGNATGAADFNAGATGAQTLRTVANQGAPNTAANGWPVMLTDGTNTASVTAAGEVKVDITQPLPAGTNVIGAVNQGTNPWITSDLADGSVTGGTAGTKSMLAGGQYNTTLPTLTNGQQAALQVDSSGRLLVDTAGTEDRNYGTVGANTLRTASQIGNATGAADFNNGATGAQTLRVAANLAVAGANVTVLNPVPVFVTSAGPSGTHVNDYKDASSIAANASDNHDYTVTALKTLTLNSVIASGSGKAKMLVQVETGVATGTFNTYFAQFNSTAETNMEVLLTDPISVAAGVRVRVVMTNLDKAAQDLYSTICGTEN